MSLVQLTGLTLLPLIVLVAQGGLLQAVAHQRVGWGDGVHLPNLTPSPVNVSVNLTLSPFRVSPQFLSVTLDASALNQPWKYVINFTLPRVVTLAKGLAPAMLRLGGTSEDFILFSEGEDLSAEENGGPVLVKGPQLVSGWLVTTLASMVRPCYAVSAQGRSHSSPLNTNICAEIPCVVGADGSLKLCLKTMPTANSGTTIACRVCSLQ